MVEIKRKQQATAYRPRVAIYCPPPLSASQPSLATNYQHMDNAWIIMAVTPDGVNTHMATFNLLHMKQNNIIVAICIAITPIEYRLSYNKLFDPLVVWALSRTPQHVRGTCDRRYSGWDYPIQFVEIALRISQHT